MRSIPIDAAAFSLFEGRNHLLSNCCRPTIEIKRAFCTIEPILNCALTFFVPLSLIANHNF